MKEIFNRCGGWRGVALGFVEGALFIGAVLAMGALMFAVAPMAGR